MPKASNRSKKFAPNIVLAGLVALTIAASVVGTALVQSAIYSAPQDVPVGTAKVNVNVLQSPARPTAQVTLYVMPKLG
jgi:hypothetical protein